MEALTVPSNIEVARAKALILNELDGGEPQPVDHLVRLLVKGEGFTDESLNWHPIDLNGPYEDHPRLKYLRLSRAGVEAIAQLAAAGSVIRANRRPTNNHDAGVNWHVDWTKANLSSGHDVGAGRPVLGKVAYRLARPDVPVWAMNTDFLLDGARGLRLPPKTLRCLEESLRAYRHGLYFGCLSLLGAGSEGAWFYLAEKVRPKATKIGKLLDGGGSAKSIQDAVANHLREDKDFRKYVDELVHSASLLRRIRNYGIHPSEEDSHLSEYFDEIKCGALLLSARDYLHRLSEIAGSPKWTTGTGQDRAPRD